MNLFILATLLVFGSFAAVVLSDSLRYLDLATFEEAWKTFKETHDKQFASGEDEFYRKQVFAENLKKIESHNYLYERGLKSYKLGINQFTDMETAEVKKMMNGLRGDLVTAKDISDQATYLPPIGPFVAPTAVNWVNQGYVTPIKDQGQCGSCWAFSATGSLEGQHFRKTGQLVSLSEQNLVDCSMKEGNEGCAGGLMDLAFTYIKKNNGIDTEQSYPYEAKNGKCRYKEENKGATDVGFVDLPPGNETALMNAVAMIGPISVAMDASRPDFNKYDGGIYDDPKCSSKMLDHGVLIVGYGTEDGQDFWVVKNSWGEKWGENGYFRIVRNKKNQCGLATMASYPLV